jgi:hypothetical protein
MKLATILHINCCSECPHCNYVPSEEYVEYIECLLLDKKIKRVDKIIDKDCPLEDM